MPIGIEISTRFDMKRFARIPEKQKLALTKSRDEGLELIRKTLRAESPSSRKGNIYSKNRIVTFLRAPSRCVRKVGRYSGYVFLNQKILPHIKYVVKSARKHSWNIPKGCKKGQYRTGRKWLYFWWTNKKTYFLGPCVTRLRHKANNFIERARVRARPLVYNITYKHFIKTIK